MATLVDMSDPGLVVLPTHRTVANLNAFDGHRFREQLSKTFSIEPQSTLEKLLAAMKNGQHLIGMRDAEGFALLRPKNLEALRPLFADKPPLWHTLDVAILHVGILEALLGIDEVRLREESNVTYWREPRESRAVSWSRTASRSLLFSSIRRKLRRSKPFPMHGRGCRKRARIFTRSCFREL